MALNFDKANTQSDSNSQDESWKSHAFLNISLPADTDSGKKKIGTVYLKLDSVESKQIIDMYAACTTPEEKAEVDAKILRNIVVDYRLASDPNRGGLKLA